MRIVLWDKEEEKELTWLESARFYINCFSGKLLLYDKCTYYGGDPFTDVSDRYEIRIEEEE